MLVRGQAPFGWSDEMSDVLAMLRSQQSPDGGDGSGNGGDGQGAGGSNGAGGGSGSGQTGSDGQPFDAQRAQALIDKLRNENKAAQAAAKERDELAARLKAIEDKDKTDSEKLAGDLKSTTDKLTAAEQRAKDLEARYTASLIGAAIEREAGKANAIDAETVAALVDRSEIKIDEAGTVTGADKAVAALLKAKPFLVKSENGAAGGMRSTPGTPAGTNGHGQSDRVADTQKELRASGRYNPL